MAVAALAPATGANGVASGNRAAASMVTRQLSDAAALSWNPTNGNIVLTGDLLHLKGVTRDMDVKWRYNSLNDVRPTLSVGTREAGVRVDASNNITYTAADGGEYTFVPDGAGGWTRPAGLNASIRSLSATNLNINFDDTGYGNGYVKSGDVYVLRSEDDHYGDLPNRASYYDTDGRLSASSDNRNQIINYVYQDANNEEQPSQIIDTTINRAINIEYNGGSGRMSKITNASGAALSFTYNSAGKIATVKDGRGTTTTLEYDTNGRAKKITYGTGTTAQSIFTPAYPTATSSTLTDPNNKTATYAFTGARQVTQVTDPNGNTTQATWDAHDNRLTSVDGLAKTTTATYNLNNSLTKITKPAAGTGTGSETIYTYAGPNGRLPIASTNSEGHVTTYGYDVNTANIDKAQTPGPNGGAGGARTWNFERDDELTTCGAQRGQLCKTTDGNGNVTSYAYDANRNPVTITRPAPLGVITNTFDAADRLITSKDGKNQTQTHTYDNNDRITQTRQGATCIPATCVTYTYDANGNLTQRVDAGGTTTITYDAQNRPTTKTIGGTTTTLTYDGASNILTSVDPLGTVTYKYDAGNRLISLAEPGGSCPATPVFPNSTKCTGFEYDANNNRTATKYPNGMKNTTVIDAAGRTTSITATNTTAGVLARRAYTYTVNGTKDGALRKTVTDHAGTVTTYNYDEVNRLTQAVTGTNTETWAYDKNSNRTVDTKTGTANVYNAYNGADQLCWVGASAGTCASPPAGAVTYAYDANGNTTTAGATTQTYNVFDQFTSNTNGGTTNYAYAGTRNDERTTADGTAFLNGALGITRQTTGGAATSFIRDPDGNLVSMRTSTGASYYYTTDALGSVILLTDSAQTKAAEYAYDSWGLTTTNSGAQAAVNPWTYAGGYNDTTSNRIKFGARYYNPWRGRFTQPDPSGQDQNRYAYVSCNPINATDPTGLGPAECFFNASAAVFSAFVVAGAGAAAVATGGLAVVGLIGAIGLEATTATAAGYYCGELIK
ncbi:RHS repeat-associated core domain-containing protein [Arthrobacter sp. FB24]|uniref:RHS repeat-associated core domain-containing protein n=1 Tax=Arthrobacter sp. (strain FB24) TaxID=290399 RepID=UPI0005BE455F|nr:RHS repeat-associated core domain-containing protein [Arthrobacter sp. FB24]